MQEIQENDYITLTQLNGLVKEIVEANFIEEVWVVAEIAELRVAGKGHCYMELVEKDKNAINARIRANIWSFNYQKIANNFFSVTGSPLQKGLKCLFVAQVGYHELYGLSLTVKNIEPSFSLGELERKKRAILEQITREGLIELNRQLELPLLPKKVAVISSSTAAGYEDFKHQIEQSKYLIQTELFSATMQGENVEPSVVQALAKIDPSLFDLVVIIRGGGAGLDLAGFDSYLLAKTISEMQLPVLSGIGHERDDTVVDHVVHTKLKTPTAVAEYIIDQFREFDDFVEGLKEALAFSSKQLLTNAKQTFNQLQFRVVQKPKDWVEKARRNLLQISQRIESGYSKGQHARNSKLNRISSVIVGQTTKRIHLEQSKIQKAQFVIKHRSLEKLGKEEKKLESIQRMIKITHPQNILNRGYAIIRQNDQVVKSINDLKDGDFTIQLKDGTISKS